jgi:hypothetical protein
MSLSELASLDPRDLPRAAVGQNELRPRGENPFTNFANST